MTASERPVLKSLAISGFAVSVKFSSDGIVCLPGPGVAMFLQAPASASKPAAILPANMFDIVSPAEAPKHRRYIRLNTTPKTA